MTLKIDIGTSNCVFEILGSHPPVVPVAQPPCYDCNGPVTPFASPSIAAPERTQRLKRAIANSEMAKRMAASRHGSHMVRRDGQIDETPKLGSGGGVTGAAPTMVDYDNALHKHRSTAHRNPFYEKNFHPNQRPHDPDKVINAGDVPSYPAKIPEQQDLADAICRNRRPCAHRLTSVRTDFAGAVTWSGSSSKVPRQRRMPTRSV